MRRIEVGIIGGSLAGAACARELAGLGVEVVAFERAGMPRDKVCGGFLSPGAVEGLDRLGLLSVARAAGAQTVVSACVGTPRGELRFDLPRPGLGISRRTLDAIVAEHAPVESGSVRSVTPVADGFHLDVDGHMVHARIVIDAAGKLSRFTPHVAEPEFGAQFFTDAFGDDHTLHFWFFQDGYGGAVGVEGKRANHCFLIRKNALDRYRSKPGCLVTGPLAYTVSNSPWIAIGDAAGMIDPFCGEGMRHALDTAGIAASVVARGLAGGWGYENMRRSYDAERHRRWAMKRRIGRVLRAAARRPAIFARGFGVAPRWFIEQVWA